MTGPIVVGVDGSPTAQRAAHKARDLAIRLGVPLHVVSAHTDATIEHVNSGSDQWVVSGADNALYIAEQVVKGLRTPGLKIQAGSAQGKPSEALIDYADKAEAEMIVVGNQRMRGGPQGARQRGQLGVAQRDLRRLHREHLRRIVAASRAGAAGHDEARPTECGAGLVMSAPA